MFTRVLSIRVCWQQLRTKLAQEKQCSFVIRTSQRCLQAICNCETCCWCRLHSGSRGDSRNEIGAATKNETWLLANLAAGQYFKSSLRKKQAAVARRCQTLNPTLANESNGVLNSTTKRADHKVEKMQIASKHETILQFVCGIFAHRSAQSYHRPVALRPWETTSYGNLFIIFASRIWRSKPAPQKTEGTVFVLFFKVTASLSHLDLMLLVLCSATALIPSVLPFWLSYWCLLQRLNTLAFHAASWRLSGREQFNTTHLSNITPQRALGHCLPADPLVTVTPYLLLAWHLSTQLLMLMLSSGAVTHFTRWRRPGAQQMPTAAPSHRLTDRRAKL